MTNYKLISSTYDLALRTGANVTFSKILNSGNSRVSGGYVLRNTEMLGNNLITLTSDVKNASGVVVGKTGDEWLEVTSIGGQSCSGFVAYVHMGNFMSVLTEVSTTPPTPPINQEIVSVTLVPHYSDGTSGQATEYFPKVI